MGRQPSFRGDYRGSIGRIDATSDRTLGLAVLLRDAVEQPTALGDQHGSPLNRLSAVGPYLTGHNRVHIVFGLTGVIYPVADHKRGAAVGHHSKQPEIVLHLRRSRCLLTLRTEVGAHDRRVLPGDPTIIANGETGQQITRLIRREIPEQFQQRRIDDAVRLLTVLDQRRIGPVPPTPRAGGPWHERIVRLDLFEGLHPPAYECVILIQAPLEVAPIFRVGNIRRGWVFFQVGESACPWPSSNLPYNTCNNKRYRCRRSHPKSGRPSRAWSPSPHSS